MKKTLLFFICSITIGLFPIDSLCANGNNSQNAFEWKSYIPTSLNNYIPSLPSWTSNFNLFPLSDNSKNLLIRMSTLTGYLLYNKTMQTYITSLPLNNYAKTGLTFLSAISLPLLFAVGVGLSHFFHTNKTIDLLNQYAQKLNTCNFTQLNIEKIQQLKEEKDKLYKEITQHIPITPPLSEEAEEINAFFISLNQKFNNLILLNATYTIEDLINKNSNSTVKYIPNQAIEIKLHAYRKLLPQEEHDKLNSIVTEYEKEINQIESNLTLLLEGFANNTAISSSEKPKTLESSHINQVFKQLALKYHPDKNQLNEEKTRILQNIINAKDYLIAKMEIPQEKRNIQAYFKSKNFQKKLQNAIVQKNNVANNEVANKDQLLPTNNRPPVEEIPMTSDHNQKPMLLLMPARP